MYWTFQQSSYVLSKVVKFFLFFFVICITSMHAVILFMDLDQYYR